MKIRTRPTSDRRARRGNLGRVGLAAALLASSVVTLASGSGTATAAINNLPPGAPADAVEPVDGGYLPSDAGYATDATKSGIGEQARHNCVGYNDTPGADALWDAVGFFPDYTRCTGRGDKNDGGDGPDVVLTAGGSSRWMGQYAVLSHYSTDATAGDPLLRLGYCLEDPKGHPGPQHTGNSSFDYVAETPAEKAALAAALPSANVVVSPVLDYVMWKYGNTYDNNTAAAVWNINHFIQQDGGPIVPSLTNATSDAAINARIGDVYAEAVAKQGPWNIVVDLDEAGTGTATVTGPSGPIFFEEFNLELTGATGPAVITTNAAGVASFSFTPDGGTVTADVTGVAPSPYLALYQNPLNGPDQTVASAGKGTPIAASDSIEVVTVVGNDLPLETQISTDEAIAGDTVSDSLIYSYGDPALDATINVDARVNVQAAILDAGDNVVELLGETTVDVSAGTTTGILPVEVPMLAAGQKVGYRHQRTGYIEDGTFVAETYPWSPWGIAAETADIDVSDPQVVTQINNQTTFAGETITDEFTVTGLVGEATADIELQLVDVTAGEEVLGTWVIEDVTNGTTGGHGEYVIPTDRAGHTLVYRERIIFTGADLDGDGVEEGEGDADGQTTDWSGLDVESETTTVARQPKVFTNTSTKLAAPGETIADTFTVIDAAAETEGVVERLTVEVALFDLTEDPDCASEPLVTATFYGATNGTYENIGRYVVRADEAGHEFGYIERIVDSSVELRQPDAEWEWSECGASSESLIVRDDLSIATQVQEQTVTLVDGAAELVDIATVAGLTDEISYEVISYDADAGEEVITVETIAAETATVNVALYGPFESIEAVECAEGTLAGEVSYQIAGNGESVSPAVEVTEGGVYTFVESVVSNDVEGREASHDCGLRSETAVVLDQPDVITEAQTNTIWFGLDEIVELADTYTVSGMGVTIDGEPQAWESELVLYGPFDGPDGVECTEAFEVATLVTSHAGDGTFTSDGIAVPEAGYYTFQETVVRTSDGASASHDCGLAEESVMIYDAPSITTNAREELMPIDESAQDGLLIDEVTLTGLAPEAGPYTVTVDWFGPYPSDLPETWLCGADEAAGTVTVDVFESGTFDMPGLQVTKGGTYIAVARAQDADGTVVASHGCNEPNEIVQSQAFRAGGVIDVGGDEFGWRLPAGFALAALAGLVLLAGQRRRRQATVEA